MVCEILLVLGTERRGAHAVLSVTVHGLWCRLLGSNSVRCSKWLDEQTEIEIASQGVKGECFGMTSMPRLLLPAVLTRAQCTEAAEGVQSFVQPRSSVLHC